MAQNNLLLAHESYARALESFEEGGFDPVAVSNARCRLALVLGALCQHQQSEQLLKRSLQDLESLEVSEETTSFRSRCLFTLGNLAYDRGRYRAAAAYYGQAVTFADRVDAERKDPNRYAEILDLYADALGHAGETTTAAAVTQRAADMRKAHPSDTPPRGRLRYDGFDNAAEQLQADLRRLEAIEGPQGPTVTARLMWLGVLESNRGNYEAALTFFKRAFANPRDTSNTGESMAIALDRYAHVLRAASRDQEAQAIEAKAAALRN